MSGIIGAAKLPEYGDLPDIDASLPLIVGLRAGWNIRGADR
jgi:hypothetical protein